ncbi:biotin--[acetyl-CoA-carboxylase] ligase [Brevibacillus humidisoli]|uniref:biotin--[acetyl-CoA-carboxylase] ligase n=1 Tax=Brevibacillus humidisoli TaxID=2895522 RepID=UPI001E44D230|nr:biotin--[acetyl-CoA-carboxylase] ligase [Brevibacillus humidisoli]UFJ42748.1 biotin--[acetyl-CoA-carboxylase] ligase [Brevibacillus humidisoli]
MNIKLQILKAFREHPEEFISGERLSELCNCSRTAVWKHIEELRQEGYQFEAVRRSGYRLLSAPDRIAPEEITVGLETDVIGQTVYTYDTVVSTQLLAHEAAGQGAGEGTLVIAEQQTGGKGRLGRPWHSPKHAGIWMSLIVKPDISLPRAPQITLLTAVAMARTIKMEAGLEADIKWPNDILIHGKKVCGILTELNAESDRINYLIIGIGVNVNTLVEEYPPELRTIATSLRIEAGRKVRRASLIQTFCTEFEQLYREYLRLGFEPIRARWEAYSVTLGKQLTVRTLNETIEGRAVGLDADGILIVEDAKGVQHKVYSADIEQGANQ